MTELLLKMFVKENDYNDEKVRNKVISFSGIVGIACNILLFIVKIIAGTLTHSVAVLSDGAQTLSDSLSCIISIAGVKLASKPADKDHPFGHGRFEYLSSLAMGVIFAIVGFEFLKTSIKQIIHPVKVIYSTLTLIILIISIAVKFWMYIFNTKIANKISSLTIKAAAKDSIGDCVLTAVTILGIVSSLFTALPIDGVVGCIVSILILKSAWEVLKETVDTLLGMPADEETINNIKNIVLSHKEIIGIHDLIVHNYGPGKMFATLHAEIDGRSNIFDSHEIIDDIEKDLYNELAIIATIHMDPLDTQNKELLIYKKEIEKILNDMNFNMSMHDFRMVSGKGHTNLIFDILIPHEHLDKSEFIKQKISEQIKKYDNKLNVVITFDTQF